MTSTTATLEGNSHNTFAGFPPPGDANPGGQRECGFPGATLEDGMCREIPVATFTQTCGCGHIELLPACQGHAEEVLNWDGGFIGTADSPGVLTCPMCRSEDAPHPCRASVLVLWDDMRPVAVIQEG